MTYRRGNLQPAHSGYRYQDIATAYTLARALSERYELVIVDRKQVDDDRIDDLEIITPNSRVRRQFKSSQDPRRQITANDFISNDSTLRIDRLILTYVRAGELAASEYRLCATWQPPDSGNELDRILEKIEAPPTIAGSASCHYRIRSELLWPINGEPIWTPLNCYRDAQAEFGREDVIRFCERFIIELSLPLASSKLSEPSQLEQALIEELTEKVGIGRYPNQDRSPVDVAALAVSLANLARTHGDSLTPANIEEELGIRTDFGRVSQSFPLDKRYFHNRPQFRQSLKEAACTGAYQLVVSPPGSGKSWELTQLCDELKDAGAIVARHYCYLEPGDELVERRVTTDVFFGNLLADLTDAAPELLGASESRYAAGLNELEETLTAAKALNRQVVLVVDGLDHISRVRAGTSHLASDDTDIVERLATLNIPDGVSIIIGSQPGQHLDPLRSRWSCKLIELQVPPWTVSDMSKLARLHGVSDAIKTGGITNENEVEEVLEALGSQADGNPLYGRYLSRELVIGLESGAITNPQNWLSTTPNVAGDIATYYKHLYQSSIPQAQEIADLLGIIDFAVTETELKGMLPALVAQWVPVKLMNLSSVLTIAAGQGGMRIFHESFRRFIVEELTRQGRSLDAVLSPVIAWLENSGFYTNAKSYRFLLPALRRAGRDIDLLNYVNVSFVSDSVQHAHPLAAIQRNLALAADVAARARKWPDLLRCVELHRSAYTCFDDSQNTWDEYWETYLNLFGSTALSERLLFDGRPTQSRADGLLACELIENADGIAPWRDYLDLPNDIEGERPDHFDSQSPLLKTERVSLAVICGRIRVGPIGRILARVRQYLIRNGREFKVSFVRGIGNNIAKVNPSLVERLIGRSSGDRQRQSRFTPRISAVLRLGLADEYARRGDLLESCAAATIALAGADTPELAVSCLERGAPILECIKQAIDPSTLTIALGPETFFQNADNIRSWVASVRLLANDPIKEKEILDNQRSRVEGVGWYRCWLRYVIELSTAEARLRLGKTGNVINAFEELIRDLRPFVGDPRSCDLYAIRWVISETIAWGLSLLSSEDEWKRALEILELVSDRLATRLDREDGGPLPTGTLLKLLIPCVSDPVGGPFVRALIEREVLDRNNHGTYYSNHAEFAMFLAQAKQAASDISAAKDAWQKASVFFAGYGWRKDITIFEILESIPALKAVSKDAAIRALVDVQPLTASVIAHTDHRSTNRAPNSWLSTLLEVEPPIGVFLLASTIAEEDSTGGWPIANAIGDVVANVIGASNPVLLDALLRTLRFKVEFENESVKAAKARLAPAMHIVNTNRSLALEAFRQVAAEVANDTYRYTGEASNYVESTARELGLTIPKIAHIDPSSRENRNTLPRSSFKFEPTWLRFAPFPQNPSFLDLLTGLRSAGERRSGLENDQSNWDDVVTSLSYHIGDLVDQGREEEARRLIFFFGRDVKTYLSNHAHPLGKLAESLDSAGYGRVATIAYALGYTCTHSGWGFRFGNSTHAHLLTRAISLDRETALQIVANEVAYGLRGSWYSIGVTSHLIERMAEWGESNAPDIEAAWRQAFSVIAHRLPLPPTSGWFAPLSACTTVDMTIDEALVALLFGKLADPRIRPKLEALRGIVLAIQHHPSLLIKPLRWWTTCELPTSSIILVLQSLWETEQRPFLISREASDVLTLLVASKFWAVSHLAELLLKRAGLPVPSPPLRGGVNDSPGDIPYTEKQYQALLSADANDSLDILTPFWPELPHLIAKQMHQLLVDENQKERCKERLRLMYGQDGKSIPPIPVLLGQCDLFLSVLNELLALGMSAQLWATGQRTADTDETLLQAILPQAALHLALSASRHVRPSWPFPSQLTNACGPLPILGEEDPTFAGWSRLAAVEKQYIVDPGRRFSPPSEVATLYAGAVAIPLSDTIPDRAFPFEEGDVNNWWRSDIPVPSFPGHLPLGRLIRLNRHTDWLGSVLILIPSIGIRSYMQLKPPAYGSPLVLADNRGDPAIVLRTWRVANKDSVSEENIEFEGSDLIARPDIVERIQGLCGVPIKELRVISREPVSDYW